MLCWTWDNLGKRDDFCYVSCSWYRISIVRPVHQQSNALPMNHGCIPPPPTHFVYGNKLYFIYKDNYTWNSQRQRIVHLLWFIVQRNIIADVTCCTSNIKRDLVALGIRRSIHIHSSRALIHNVLVVLKSDNWQPNIGLVNFSKRTAGSVILMVQIMSKTT